MTRKRCLPAWIRSDASYGVLHAYYAYVLGAEVSFPDVGGDLVAAHARSATVFIGADFSTTYEFPAERGGASVRDQLHRRAEHLVRLSAVGGDAPSIVRYEVWCFIPPSERLQDAAASFEAPRGCAVELIQGVELSARVRQAVLAVPHRAGVDEPEPETAFVDCADTIREAFGLGGG